MITLNPNGTLGVVNLRNGVAMTANNHSNGTSFATYKGELMVVLSAGAPTGDAAANFTANIYAAPNADRDIKTHLVHSFTQVTNAAASRQQVAIDTRNLGPNVYLSTEVNVAGTNFTAPIFIDAYGWNSSAG